MIDARGHRVRRALLEIEARAGAAVFSLDPYVKFLPLMFRPPALDWSRVRRCAPSSRRRIVIPAWGRDPIASDGWLRFAALTAYSALHCVDIERWAIDVVTAGPPSVHPELDASTLFGPPVHGDLARLRARGVRVREVSALASAGDIYKPFVGAAEILLRVDADSLLLPGALAGCFRFDARLGYSDLNRRHTGRSGLGQLVHPADGRMLRWPRALRRSAAKWVTGVVRTARRVFGEAPEASVAQERMHAVPWLSEGLSYADADRIEEFAALRSALLAAGLVPDWDEEAVKLALVGVRAINPEACRVPVLEHWEYGPQTPDCAVVNLRNSRSHGDAVAEFLTSNPRAELRLDYVDRIAADLVARARASGAGA